MILFMNLLWAEPIPNDDSEKSTTTTSEDTTEEAPALIKMPELVEYVQAPYPVQAKEEGREGVVLLLIEIDEVGEISYVEILRSAGKDFDDYELHEIETEYFENKFKYKRSFSGSIDNVGVYLMKFENLNLEQLSDN